MSRIAPNDSRIVDPSHFVVDVDFGPWTVDPAIEMIGLVWGHCFGCNWDYTRRTGLQVVEEDNVGRTSWIVPIHMVGRNLDRNVDHHVARLEKELDRELLLVLPRIDLVDYYVAAFVVLDHHNS
jgi:hypothetical protein